jgi:hypothetical protein
MNVLKKRPKHKKMTSAGRVSGFGLSTKVGVHFKEDSKTRKQRRSKVEEAQRREITDLKAQVAAKFEARLRQVIPPQLWEGLAAWNAAGGVGPIPVPSVSSSVTTQDFIKFWGKIFVFILLVLIENLQRFKTF